MEIQWKSKEINGNPMKSNGNQRNQWKSNEIQWKSKEINGNLMGKKRNQWKYNGHQRKSIEIQ